MKQSMFKSIKGFFNSNKPKSNQYSNKNTSKQQMQPRVISFGPTNPTSVSQITNSSKSKIQEDEKQTNINLNVSIDVVPDTRYNYVEELPTLKQMGLKKDQIQEGEIAVLEDNKFVFCKMADGKYQQIKIIVTNYKLCIITPTNDPIFFSLSKIDKLNKYTANQSVYKMLIQLKDGRKFKFRINSQSAWKKIYDKIQTFAFIKNKKHFFAFRHYDNNQKLQSQHKGWKLYDPLTQFKRMGINPMEHTQDIITNYTSQFKILDNKDGKICSTYPPIMIVPARMPYDAILRCARFRSKQRMPALSYAYQYQQGKFSTVYRSSQSKVGVQNSRSPDDQLMLKMIGNPRLDIKNQGSNVVNCKIYDARGFYAAFGNKISGKGYQSQQFYTNCKLQFLNIPNIHAVRQSYNKTVDAAYGEDAKFFTSLAQSKWYQYVFLILYGALDLAKNLSQGFNCLVHCSDGWDRTSQLCSLGAMLLDPYYRSMEGFQILIQKDWINFGHQFAKRIGQGMNNPMSQQKSQVFLQFLDCVTQIMHQFPSQFEFNFKYIQQIGEQAYSNLYGNFLSNCYFQMLKYGIKQSTVSLWSKFKKDKDQYINPFYVPVQKTLLTFDANEKNMRFWKQHFLQHIDNFKDVYGIYSCKFTQDNLQIIHRHLAQEKILLKEKFLDNQNTLSFLQKSILQLQRKLNGQTQIQQIQQKQKQKQKQEVKQVVKQKQNFQKLKQSARIYQQQIKIVQNQEIQNCVDQLVDLQTKIKKQQCEDIS